MTSFAGGDAIMAGLALGGASILSVGPNNVMIIREGLTRGRALTVATAVWASYLVLIVLAVALAGSVARVDAAVQTVLLSLGLVAIAYFAGGAFRAVLRGSGGSAVGRRPLESRGACLARVMAVVWLNPLTYVELLLVPCALCGTLGTRPARIEFALALAFMGAVCCYGYACGGELCGVLLRHRRVLQLFDLLSGVLLVGVGLSLAVKLV